MSFIGPNSTPLANCVLAKDVCPSCGRANSRHLFLVQDYIDILFMPFFSSGKSGEIRCQNCPEKVSHSRLTEDESLELEELKLTAKTPLWIYSGIPGLIVIILLFVFVPKWLWHSDPAKSGQSAVISMIQHPNRGDLYEVKMAEDEFSWCRIDSLSADSVWLGLSTAYSPIKAGLSAIRNEPFDTVPMIIHRRDLKTMYDEKQVLNIHREK